MPTTLEALQFDPTTLEDRDLLLRVSTKTGTWNDFPCGTTAVFDVHCGAGLYEAERGLGEDGDVVFAYVQSGTVLTSQDDSANSLHRPDDLDPTLEVNLKSYGLRLENPTTEVSTTAIQDLLSHEPRNSFVEVLATTFCGTEAVRAFMEQLEDIDTPEARRVWALSALAINYAQEPQAALLN